MSWVEEGVEGAQRAQEVRGYLTPAEEAPGGPGGLCGAPKARGSVFCSVCACASTCTVFYVVRPALLA